MSTQKKYPLRAAWYGLIIVASVLPALALSPWIGQQAHELLLDRAMLEEEIFHSEVETRLALETKRLVSILTNKADPMGMIWADGDRKQLLDSLIERISKREKIISSIAIYDTNARLITGSKNKLHSFAVMRNDMPEFAVPMHARSYLGAPIKLPDGHYEFLISVPISHQGRVVGILTSTISIDQLWSSIRTSLPEHESNIYLLDGRGSLLVQYSQTEHSRGDLLSDKEIVRSLLAGTDWKRHDIYKGFEEKPVFGIASLVPTLKWGIISEIPASTIMAPIITALKTLTIIVFALHIVFGLISILFTRHLLAPISELAHVVKQAAEGDYSHEVKQSRYSEIDTLTTNFNSMIHEIDRRETALSKLSQAVDQAGEAIMITDSDGILEYINPAFTHITGYSHSEAIGQSPKSLVNSGMQSRSFYEKLWSDILGGTAWEGTLTNRRKDGSLYPALMSIAPIYSEDKITHFVAIQQDMSNQSLLEEQLRQSQKMESLGTLVGGIAHDFNNLLGGMTGNLYLARIKAKGSPEIIEKIRNVEALSFKAADLISQLLAFARKSAVQMQHIDLSDYIKDALKLIKAGIPESITLKTKFCEDSLPISGDKTQIHQILMNLLSNAKDATLEGSNPHIQISTSRFEATDSFRSFHPNHKNCDSYARITIQDNGHGISEAQLEHIFEPFFTTKEIGKGSGLGLSMIYGAMQTHNAIIDVNSQLNYGTEFHLYFPLIEAEDEVSEKHETDQIDGRGETILLVDDESELCETCAEILESMAYQPLSASDGKEGLNRFIDCNSEISLIITDVVMPKMSGPEMVRKIRQLQPEIPVIFMTGYDKELLSKEIDIENSVVIPKPVDIQTLGIKINELLKGQKSQGSN